MPIGAACWWYLAGDPDARWLASLDDDRGVPSGNGWQNWTGPDRFRLLGDE